MLTEDLVIILGEDDCKCGRKGKYFKIIGRLKNAELKKAELKEHFKNIYEGFYASYINLMVNKEIPESVKQILYYQAKDLAQRLHITPPRWLGSSIVSLRQFIHDNTRQPLPFLHQIQNYLN